MNYFQKFTTVIKKQVLINKTTVTGNNNMQHTAFTKIINIQHMPCSKIFCGANLRLLLAAKNTFSAGAFIFVLHRLCTTVFCLYQALSSLLNQWQQTCNTNHTHWHSLLYFATHYHTHTHTHHDKLDGLSIFETVTFFIFLYLPVITVSVNLNNSLNISLKAFCLLWDLKCPVPCRARGRLLTCHAGERSIEGQRRRRRQRQQLASLFGVQIKPAGLGCCILATRAQLGCSVPDLGPFTSL